MHYSNHEELDPILVERIGVMPGTFERLDLSNKHIGKASFVKAPALLTNMHVLSCTHF
jgi:hypothetical protein